MGHLKLNHQNMDNLVITATKSQVSSNLAGETVILNLDSGVYYGLDAVGAHIWSLIEGGPKTVGQIKAAILAEYEVDAARCEQDLAALFQQLAEHNLIEVV